MNFLPWPEIGNFHNLRKYLKQFPEVLEGYGKVRYFAKVKLDGTNAAVVVTPNKEIGAQSRSKIITPNDDNMGFARWVDSQKSYWEKLSCDDDLIIFGEWSGKGIQKNVAVSQISKKIFVVFSIVYRDINNNINCVFDPEEIKKVLGDIPDVYILPWFSQKEENFSTTVDWLGTAEDLQPELDRINQAVLDVETCDPWVKENFGIEGIGEGLVFYPLGSFIDSWTKFSTFLFKAKGEKHKTVKQSAPAQANAEITNSANEFADLVLTEARLEQGAREVWYTYSQTLPENWLLPSIGFDLKLIGKFLKWIEADVKKETSAELAVSQLTWEQVSKNVTNQARQWYLEKNKVL